MLAGLTFVRVQPCPGPGAPALGNRLLLRSAPPWTFSPASACRGGSAWASPRVSWVGLLTGGRGQRSTRGQDQYSESLQLGGFLEDRAKDDLLTNFIARWQVLILMAGKPFLTVQQQEVDHLLLVLTGRRDSGRGREKLCDVKLLLKIKATYLLFSSLLGHKVFGQLVFIPEAA